MIPVNSPLEMNELRVRVLSQKTCFVKQTTLRAARLDSAQGIGNPIPTKNNSFHQAPLDRGCCTFQFCVIVKVL